MSLIVQENQILILKNKEFKCFNDSILTEAVKKLVKKICRKIYFTLKLITCKTLFYIFLNVCLK